MQQNTSTLQFPGRRYRRSSSLEEDGEDIRKKLQFRQVGVAINASETAPSASYFHENGMGRCRTAPKLCPVPQSQPERPPQYLSNNSGPLSMSSAQKSNPGSLETLVVQCNLCCEDYCEQEPRTIPRNLSCGHTYCTACLKKLLLRSDFHTSTIVCPNFCHEETRVKGYNVANIPKNYALLNILREVSPTRRRSRREEADAVTKQIPKCPEHDDFLRSFCVDDGKLVCSSCELFGSHKGHKTMFVNEAALEDKKRLKMLRPDVLKQRDRMEEARDLVDGICTDTQKAGGQMEDEVERYFGSVISLIEEKKAEVIRDIRIRTQLRVKALLEQAKDLLERTEQASTVYQKSEELIFADDYDVLREARLVLEQIEGVFVNPPPTAPKARNDLKCMFKDDIQTEVSASIARAAAVVPEVVAIDASQITVEAFYDGFRISWDQQNFADNQAISYHLQMAKGEEDFVNIYRGSTSKYTLKIELEGDIQYKFRIQVRTTEGVGVWSEPKIAIRPEPNMHWHKKWRSVRVDLSCHDLEASRLGGSNHWGTFAANQLLDGSKQYYTEVEVLSLGKHRPREKLVIGLISCSTKSLASMLDWQNGKKPIGEWDTPSLGFFPISGVFKSHMLEGRDVAYGQDLKIQVGDRIGVLLDMGQKKLSFFCNGIDLGVAADSLQGNGYLLAVSIRDKIRVRLRFPPPPYTKRTIGLIQLRSSSVIV